LVEISKSLEFSGWDEVFAPYAIFTSAAVNILTDFSSVPFQISETTQEEIINNVPEELPQQEGSKSETLKMQDAKFIDNIGLTQILQ